MTHSATVNAFKTKKGKTIKVQNWNYFIIKMTSVNNFDNNEFDFLNMIKCSSESRVL